MRDDYETATERWAKRKRSDDIYRERTKFIYSDGKREEE